MLVVGLGNPVQYDGTRHNVGKETVIYCANSACDSEWVKDPVVFGKYKECNDLIYFAPDTFMNVSGEAVYRALEEFSMLPEQLIVVHDDISYKVGEFRISFNKSSGGHNGVESLISELNTKEFVRIRIGINKNPEGKKLSDYVLEEFTSEEAKVIDKVKSRVCKAISDIKEYGLQYAMNKYNKS